MDCVSTWHWPSHEQDRYDSQQRFSHPMALPSFSFEGLRTAAPSNRDRCAECGRESSAKCCTQNPPLCGKCCRSQQCVEANAHMKRSTARGCKGGAADQKYDKGPFYAAGQDARAAYEKCARRHDEGDFNARPAHCIKETRGLARLQHDGEAPSAQHHRAESVLTLPCIHAMVPDLCGPVGYLTDHSMVYDGRRCVGNDTHNVGEECPQTEKSIAALLGQQTYRPSASGDSAEEYVNSEESLQPQYVRIKAPCVEVTSDLTGVTPSSSAVHPGRSSEKTLDQIRKDASHEVRWQWMDRCDRVDREWKDFDEARSRELEWAYHNKRSSKLHLIWRIDGACIEGTVCFRTLTFTSVEPGWQRDMKRWKVAKCAWA